MVTGKEQEAKHTNTKKNTPAGAKLVKTEFFRGTVEPDVKQSGKAVILLPGLAVGEMMS